MLIAPAFPGTLLGPILALAAAPLLDGCASAVDGPVPSMTLVALDQRPVAGTTGAGDPIRLGGLSGLAFLGSDPEGRWWRFVSTTDRGPNCEPIKLHDERGRHDERVKGRPFPLPRYQPELVFLEVAQDGSAARITRRVGLTRPDDTLLTGLPNTRDPEGPDASSPAGPAGHDEAACDLHGAPVANDPFGVDTEGVAVAPDGSFWLCEEYRPSLLHVSADGRLIERWVPAGGPVAGEAVRAALPAIYAQRAANRGFEGLVLVGDTLMPLLESPLDNPDTPKETSSRNSRVVRVPFLSASSAALTAERVYLLDAPGNKIGDATVAPGGDVFVVERGAGRRPTARIYRIDAAAGTDLRQLPAEVVGPGGTLEGMTSEALAAAGIVPMPKTLVLDLDAVGGAYAKKIEGCAFIDAQHLALVNDDDFGLAGAFDPVTGRLAPNESPEAVRIAIASFPLGALVRTPAEVQALDPAPAAEAPGGTGLGGARESTGTRLSR
ncbi:MAG: esterase-like activity of phytase family protein [Phycisphaerales bacterium]